MPYDLFISYSRRDNTQGRITELKQQIEADYPAFVGPNQHRFFGLAALGYRNNWVYAQTILIQMKRPQDRLYANYTSSIHQCHVS